MAVGIDEYVSWVTARPWVMVTVYIIRTGLMNCTYPLQALPKPTINNPSGETKDKERNKNRERERERGGGGGERIQVECFVE